MAFKILSRDSWSKSLQQAWATAQKRIPWVMENPDKARSQAEKAAAEIRGARRALDRWKALLGRLSPAGQEEQAPKFSSASRQWYEVASAFYGDSFNAKTFRRTEEIGIAPIIVAGVVLAVAAVAFAPAAYERARAQRLYSEGVVKELEARVQAGKEGRTLQASTMPPPPPPAGPIVDTGSGGGMGLAIGLTVGVLVLGGGAILVMRR